MQNEKHRRPRMATRCRISTGGVATARRNFGCGVLVAEQYTLCEKCGPWQYAPQPAFVANTQPLSGTDIAAVIQGGCASGAWMPAVTYWQSAEILQKYEDEILELLAHAGVDMAMLISAEQDNRESYRDLGCKLVSAAVEIWCCRFEQSDILWNDDSISHVVKIGGGLAE